MQAIASRPLFSINLESSPRSLGQVPAGYVRRISAISEGRFEGDRLRGNVLSGGGDWVVIRSDGVMQMDVRALLETDHGDLIYMTYGGRLVCPEGMTLPPPESAWESLYFRSTVLFETSSQDLGWINNIVAVGIGRFLERGLAYDVHEIL